jgi:hypothetical protein
MKILIVLTLLLVPSFAYGTGCRNNIKQVKQVQQLYSAGQQLTAYLPIPVLAQHQNSYNQNFNLQQNVQYAQVQQQNVKQKIRSKQVVQRQKVKNRNLRERVQNLNMADYNYDNNAQQLQGGY